MVSVNWICQKMPYLIHGNPSFQNIQFGETKIVLKLSVFSTFLKQAKSKIFRFNGFDIALFDNETHFSLFSKRFLTKTRFEEDVLIIPRSSQRPSKMSRTAWRSPHLMRPKMTSKPTNLMRNENIQFTATTCTSNTSGGVRDVRNSIIKSCVDEQHRRC